ncbi:MAG: protein kinase [Anaerolineae bacterium]|jgi:serine/threonine protein kinase|nr:protein kinase [Anaerolineae bacterium]
MTNDALIGKRLANFQIERLLAHGGMADVYYGLDVNLQRPVAIKVIDARFRKNPAYAQRFISEARAMAAWRHENIVQVYYADQQDDLYYFVMEYIDGLSLDVLLRKYAERGAFLPYADVLHIGRAVAGALDYAHRRGVIHRDIKPPNVMISTDNRVMLMDFGLALDTQQGSMGEVFGTPHYIAPEQARRSADATPLSDVYSMGVMLFEMLTGVVPFDDPSATSVAILHLSEPPPKPRSINPALSSQVEAVLLKVLEKEPKNRYSSTLELMQALERALAASPGAASPVELPPLPPGVVLPEHKPGWTPTLAERVSLLMRQDGGANDKTLVMDQLSRTSATKPKPKPGIIGVVRGAGRRRVWLWVALVLLVAAGGLVVALSWRGAGGDVTPTVAAVIASATDAPPTNEPTTDVSVLLPSVIPPTVVTPSETPAPSETPSETPTASHTPTATRTPFRLVTNTPEPTNTPRPTRTPTATASVSPAPTSLTPTVMYPDGAPIQLLWNVTSFYIHNPNDQSVMVQPLTFEALVGDLPAAFVLRGERWMTRFPVIEAGNCVGIELIDRENYLVPERCEDYNALLTFLPESDENIWLRREGISTFRVLWEGQEIARCRIADRACTVFVPAGE